MRLTTIRTAAGATCVARVEGDDLILLDACDVLGALDGTAAEIGETVSAASAVSTPPVLRPAKVIGVGLNYRSHLIDLGIPLPEFPTLFAKFASSLLGSRDDLVLPAVTTKAIWEAELAVVMGVSVPRGPIDLDQAASAIGGFTVANDVTMRDFQRHGKQWLPGKAFDAATPLGPVVVTADELSTSSLRVTCEVDGKVVQDGTTADLLFSPAELIRYIVQFAALEPGDIILTGTPAGAGPDSTEFLQSGQIMTTTIEGIGSCRNRVVTGR